ncbi:MAG: hypothetical protein D9V47_02685 [Clostridia bacterium]|nr:MAG: hypothetical protein D9V47_02685 [Clostridia bacterium]
MRDAEATLARGHQTRVPVARLGATCLEDGRCQFLVWVPRAEEVAVYLLAPRERIVPLARAGHLVRWREYNRQKKPWVHGRPVPDANTELVLYQTLKTSLRPARWQTGLPWPEKSGSTPPWSCPRRHRTAGKISLRRKRWPPDPSPTPPCPHPDSSPWRRPCEISP